MKVLSVILALALIAFIVWQGVGIVKDVRKRLAERKAEKDKSEKGVNENNNDSSSD